MQTTILPSCTQGSEFSPLLEAVRGQFTAFSCNDEKAGIGDCPLHLLGAAIKIRSCPPVWTAVQLCGHHINALACSLSIQALTQTFRFNISAWSQAFSITMGLLWPRVSAKPARGHQCPLLALLRCGGTGSLSVRLLPVPVVFPSSAASSLSLRSRLPLLLPGRFFLGHFSFRLLLLLK